MKFKMALVVEDHNGLVESFSLDSCNALESKLQEMGEKYPLILEAEHSTVITLKIAHHVESIPLPEEAFQIEMVEEEFPTELPAEEYLEEVSIEPLEVEPDNNEEDDSSESEAVSCT